MVALDRPSSPGTEAVRRRLGWCGLALLLLAIPVGLILLLARATEPRVTRAKLELVREGMTRAEVEALIGVPPGDYASGTVFSDCKFVERPEKPWAYSAEWTCDDGLLFVYFDENDRVVWAVTYNGWVSHEPTLFEKLRSWLGL